MKDIKVIDTLKGIQETADYLYENSQNPLLIFAEAVSMTRKEPGVSIKDIAKCFKAQFDQAELDALKRELNY